ncbi:MAG: hypothetical protein KY476_21295 [Planctomycetes bacterium]|nr:hypothetical protein [Planctomycetota bacterium]
MPYSRRILHYSPGPADLVGEVSDRAIAGCWFELKRQGGCGDGELVLRDDFSDRAEIDVGDWIACEYGTGDRWYLGKVVERSADSPAGVRLTLRGMASELAEVFPGGYGPHDPDAAPPHRYAATDLFANDPDYAHETVDSADEPRDVIEFLVQQYVVPKTHLAYNAALVNTTLASTTVTSLKFRGEETAESILRELALRARNAAWGVDETGTFFFLRKCTNVGATFQAGDDALRLVETRERDLLYNRILLTGGLVYGSAPASGECQCVYRWRGHYVQPASRTQYGERRIRLWLPWIRTAADSREFAREFFRVYAQPATCWLVEAADQTTLIRPWLSRVRLNDRHGNELTTTHVETVRVQFDHRPRFRLLLGPADPRELWPEPPHEERHPIVAAAASGYGGELLSLTSLNLAESCPPSSSSGGSSFGSSLSGSLGSD